MEFVSFRDLLLDFVFDEKVLAGIEVEDFQLKNR